MLPTFIFCIDDCRQVLSLRRAALESRGYSVKTALSGSSWLTTLEVIHVDAVLLEYKSEGMDAEAVALHIKGRFPSIPIVLLSAYSEIPERILWLVDEYVMKSAPLDLLVKAIERVIAHPPAMAA